ncbi:MAG: hypothetical protein AAFY88_19265, partial [Acidobacteriota bacterium]
MPILKLHGSVVDALSIAETLQTKLKLGVLDLGPAARQLLDGTDMLILGFGGYDMASGIVRRYFDHFEKVGGRLFWLHLPSQKPDVPHPLGSVVHWIEGSLPETLRDLAEPLGITLPNAARSPTFFDSKARLSAAIQSWAGEPHIGRWAAAGFFVSSLQGEEGTDLLEYLLEETLAQAEQKTAGRRLDIDDLGMCTALTKIAGQALRRTRLEDAKTLQKLEIRLLESFQAAAQQHGGQSREALSEYYMNSSTAYNNLAHTLMIEGDINQAAGALASAASRGYLGGQTQSFLVALTNLLHYRDGFQRIRQTLHECHAILHIAEREGFLALAIEAGTLATLLHAVRNQVPLARALWRKVEAWIDLSPTPEHRSIHRVLGIDLRLRTGDVEGALHELCGFHEQFPATAVLHGSASELSSRLEILGLERKFPFDIDLDRDLLIRHLPTLRQQIEGARGAEPPFEGQLFRLYQSSAVDEIDTQML